MPYRRKEIYSGKMLEVEVYPINLKDRKQPRKTKEKLSTVKQKNLNDKNAKKHLIRLINTNFTDKDLSVNLDYSNKYLPSTPEEAKKDVTNFLRRIKHYRKKNNLSELKYIAVIEFREQEEGKKAIRMHHHLVINDIDRDIVEKLWGKGRANADRLKADEYGYEGLARYISKDPKGNKRWVQSKNLKQPKVSVNDFEYTKRKVSEIARNPEDRTYFENEYPGYILNDCTATINDEIGCAYLYIRLRKLE